MLIGFTGTNSSGKSTLLKLCEEKYGNKFQYVKEITRQIAAKGFKINEEGDEMTQLLIINSHIQNSFKQNTFLDRCIVDGLAYTEYLVRTDKIQSWVLEHARKVFDLLILKYDVIFYTDPAGINLEEDGVRLGGIKGQNFRGKMTQIFESYFARFPEFNKRVVKLAGSIETRMEVIDRVLKQNDQQCLRKN